VVQTQNCVLTYPPQHQSRVLGAEGDAVAYRVLNGDPSSSLGNIVEVAIRIRVFQVDGGRK